MKWLLHFYLRKVPELASNYWSGARESFSECWLRICFEGTKWDFGDDPYEIMFLEQLKKWERWRPQVIFTFLAKWTIAPLLLAALGLCSGFLAAVKLLVLMAGFIVVLICMVVGAIFFIPLPQKKEIANS
ncbi:MAG TPA: hypothetical protein VJI74_02285 [Candidatus Paceibacterota bacterium]